MVDFTDIKRIMQVLDEKSGKEEFCTCAILLFVMEGQMRVKLQSNSVVLNPEDMLVVNINDSYAFQNEKDTFFIKVIIPNEVLDSIGEVIPVFRCNSVMENNDNYGKIRITLRRLLMNYWLQEQEQMKQEVVVAGFAAHYYHLIELLMEYFQVKEEYGDHKKVKNDERTFQISSYIQKNYAKPISLQELCEHLYLSEGYLSRYFKQKFGMNFSNYLKKIRLAHVMDDLRNTDHNITQIIYENGFSGPAFFYKEFKREYGVSPSEIRDKMARKRRVNIEQNQNIYNEKLEKYLRQESIEDEDSEVIKREVCVKEGQEKPLIRSWNKILNIGSAVRLLDSETREQAALLKKTMGIEYIRIWDIFSTELLIDIEETEGQYNYRKLDQVLDFILSLKVKPFFDLEKKTIRINTNVYDTLAYSDGRIEFSDVKVWSRLIESTLEHWIERYGAEEVAGWKIEVWYGGYWLKEKTVDESFWNIFEETYRIIKRQIPQIKIGGPGIFPGCMSEVKENVFLKRWSQRKIHPDFISVMSYGYEVDRDTDLKESLYERMETRKAFGQKSRDEGFLHKQIEKIKSWLKDIEMDECEIYISEWNKTISDRCFLSDSCYQGAYVMQNMIETCDAADAVVYNGGLDLQTEYYDSKDILFGGKGLLSKDGIFKPSGYALQFMNELYETQLLRDKDCLVTKNSVGDYAIVCHNMKTLSQYYYYIDEAEIKKESLWKCFEDRKKKRIVIHISDVDEGNYRIKTWRVNEKFGSVLDVWKTMDFEQHLSRDDKKYLDGICQPQLTLERRTVKDAGIQLQMEMEANEIALVKIKKL